MKLRNKSLVFSLTFIREGEEGKWVKKQAHNDREIKHKKTLTNTLYIPYSTRYIHGILAHNVYLLCLLKTRHLHPSWDCCLLFLRFVLLRFGYGKWMYTLWFLFSSFLFSLLQVTCGLEQTKNGALESRWLDRADRKSAWEKNCVKDLFFSPVFFFMGSSSDEKIPKISCDNIFFVQYFACFFSSVFRFVFLKMKDSRFSVQILLLGFYWILYVCCIVTFSLMLDSIEVPIKCVCWGFFFSRFMLFFNKLKVVFFTFDFHSGQFHKNDTKTRKNWVLGLMYSTMYTFKFTILQCRRIICEFCPNHIDDGEKCPEKFSNHITFGTRSAMHSILLQAIMIMIQLLYTYGYEFLEHDTPCS